VGLAALGPSIQVFPQIEAAGMLEKFVERVEAGGSLSMEEMSEAIGRIMAGGCEETWTARFLVALHQKGETVAEVAGAALALRRQMKPIRSTRDDVLDTC
jgi:anthranilate phosphoribosyltransferase